MTPSRRGSILVLALWALMMLSVFALSLGFGVRQRAALLNRLTTLDALYPIAYSGVEKAKSLVKSDPDPDVDILTDAWASAVPESISMVNGVFSLGTAGHPGLVDEERKINLNTATPDALSRLFQSAAGLDRDGAQEIVYCLLDWMDTDSGFGHPQYGAETSYYEDLKVPYEAKDAPYEVLDEMLLVKGITPGLFEKIKPFVTVYGNGQVNINTAPREVLNALGFSAVGTETIARYRAGGDGVDGTSDDNFFISTGVILKDLANKGGVSLDAPQELVLTGLVDSGRLGVFSTAFSVTGQAVLARNGASLEFEAVVDRRGNVRYYRSLGVKL